MVAARASSPAGPAHPACQAARRSATVPDVDERTPDRPATLDGPAATSLPGSVIAALDDLVTEFHRAGGQPGVAYGVVAAGALAHAGGAGQRWLGGPVPDAGTVFRIASMTKSFTAAAVLALRDDGVLRLDDAAADYVPDLRGMRQASADSPPITIRQLLTMTGGFPTDDPWGDRQQALPLADFDDLVRGGLRQAWAPGTRFEYANLGYALLGRVIAAAAGTGYREFVTGRLLAPLGMTRTGFEAGTVDGAGLARGYQRAGADWAELVPDGYGAFAPMGGIFSCVSDLARWVSGFAAAFPPGAAADGGGHPVRRSARREMQLAQVLLPAAAPSLPGGEVADGPRGYGFGLFVTETAAWGRLVFHSGGYPGFGSHMRWHPGTGLGVIVLANSTYAAAHPLAAQLMEVLLRGVAGTRPGAPAVAGPGPAPGGPWPETRQAQRAADQLLRSWDDQAADQLFAPNVALDEPYSRRREQAERLRERIGPLRRGEPRPAEFDSPAHCRWWLAGEHGTACAEIRVTAERPPRVQLLALAVPPAPGGLLGKRALALVALLNFLLNDPFADWPADLPVAGPADTGLLLRRLRMAAAWAGRCRPGAWCGGNGESRTVLELEGEHARLTLAVDVDPDGQLRRVEITLPA
jgi:CubicO group peptidase (beta-lactamase class C family)